MNALNFKNKVTLATIALILLGGFNTVFARTVDFSGYTWNVKETASGNTMGPGANNWGSTVADDKNDVYVDSDGKLHLFVSQRPDGSWYSSEVSLDQSFGYGSYFFGIESRLDLLDKNLVAAYFLYQDDTHEIDIEHSFWSNTSTDKNLYFSVQPAQKEGNQKKQNFVQWDGLIKENITWKPNNIYFTVGQNDDQHGYFSYTTSTDGTSDNFTPGRERVHINFWQYNNLPPINTSSIHEIVISKFVFSPLLYYTNPTLLTTIASSTNSVTLQWDTNNSATGTVYKISGNGFMDVYNDIQETNIRTSTVSELLTPDTQYTFIVQSLDDSGALGDEVTISDYTKAADPIDLTAQNITSTSLILSWNNNNNPSSTLYLISNTSSTLGTTNTSTFEINNLTPNTSYTFNVVSTNNQQINNTNTPASITVTTKSNGNSNNNGGGNNNILITQEKINSTVNSILSFFKKNQNSDGYINDANTSDWVGMSFGANGVYSDTVKKDNTGINLKDYIYSLNISDENNLCAAYPRHILTILAAGTAKTDSKITDLKKLMDEKCISNNSYGLSGINDDVFGLIAALALDENQSSMVVSTTLASIKADQQTDGSFTWDGWPGADMTGAAINALKYAQNKGITIDQNIFSQAKQYLKAKQHNDGGWGCYDYNNGCLESDTLTTGWAIMGINSLAETQNDWFNNAGKNPWHILTTLDNDHFTPSWGGVDWFATKHAVPALLGKSWPIILDPKPITNNQNNGGGTSNQQTTTTTPTTTSTFFATTTITLTTSTTSTPSISPTTTPVVKITTSTTSTILTSNPENKPVLFSAPTSKIQNISSTTTIKPTDQTTTTQPQQELSTGKPQPAENKTLDNLPLDTPTKKHAKKVLAISGGSALAVGAYLGLRLLRNMI